MVNAIYACVWLAALFKWGDWRNWKAYYPTILFFILGYFLYLYLLSDRYPMWRYSPPNIDQQSGITNTHVALSIMLIKYPATILIYLSKFPNGQIIKKVLYILCWVIIFAVNEFIDRKGHLIKYYNGWNYYWSILFNAVMFFLLWVHHKKTMLAWVLSILFIVFLWKSFHVPSSVFR
ncbi:CBO0543 family protein [Neobacillus sp. Marseille-QA0830]